MNKKAGFEMSITTLVVIVIAVVMLILGLVFVRQIFGTASKSISIVDEQVRSKLQTLFGETGRNPIVYSSEVSIKPGSESFSIPFAAKIPDDARPNTKTSELKYSINIGDGTCGVDAVKGWLIIPSKLNDNTFDSAQPEAAYQDLVFTIGTGTTPCSQRVQIVLTYPKSTGTGTISNYFTLKVVRGGIF